MSNKEALDWCEQFTDNLVMVDVDTKKRTLGLQAMQVCKSALKKQTPQKPIKHGFDPNALISTVSYTCPACNKHIGRDKFCKHCSQALDWGDSE